jgi:hypothetical protein
MYDYDVILFFYAAAEAISDECLVIGLGPLTPHALFVIAEDKYSDANSLHTLQPLCMRFINYNCLGSVRVPSNALCTTFVVFECVRCLNKRAPPAATCFSL